MVVLIDTRIERQTPVNASNGGVRTAVTATPSWTVRPAQGGPVKFDPREAGRRAVRRFHVALDRLAD
jgi:hypothetical protein